MSLDPICILDLETVTFTKVNPAFTSVLGYGEKEFLNKSLFNFIHPDDRERTVSIFDTKLKHGEEVIKYRTRCLCKDGGFRWLSWVRGLVPV